MRTSFLIIPMLLLSAGTQAPRRGGPQATKAPLHPAEPRWWVWKLVPRPMPKPTTDRG
jgi:hypothetical protein